MKRLIIHLVTSLLLLSLTVPAFAAGGAPKVVDQADLLTTFEEVQLEEHAQRLADQHRIDVVILTGDSLAGKNITAYADDYFDYNDYGIGSDHSGVLLMLSMERRDWAISTCGKGIEALTDYGQEKLMDEVLPYLGDDEYYKAFDVYLEELEDYFEAHKNGKPIDKGRNIILDLVIALGIGALAGFITITVMKSGMKTVKPQRSAQSYVTQNSYKLHQQKDVFLYSRTSRTRKQSSSSGGGSSTHRSSSGRSHGGSRGKF